MIFVCVIYILSSFNINNINENYNKDNCYSLDHKIINQMHLNVYENMLIAILLHLNI